MRTTTASLLFVALVAASASAAAAPTAAERETARRLMDDGKARLKANDAVGAASAFEKAHDIMHVPTTGIALARAHLAAGHLVEARDVALEVGRLPHDPSDPAVFENARKSARELDRELKGRIPTLRIKVRGGAAARLSVDDVEIAVTIAGEPVAVNPGKHVVAVRGVDGAEAKADAEVGEREARDVELALPIAVTKPGVVVAPPVSPPPAHPLPPTEEPEPPHRTTFAKVLIYGGFGVGVIGLGVGGVTGGLTLSQASDVKPLCEGGICAPEARGPLTDATTMANVSTVAFIAGGAGVVLGIVGLLLPRGGPARSGLVVYPSGLGGSF